MRISGVLFLLILLAAGSVPAAEALADRFFAVVTFQRLDEAWAALQESGFVRKLTATPLAMRIGLVSRVTAVRNHLLKAEKDLGVEILEPIHRVAAGRGYVAVTLEDGVPRALVDLYPEGPVSFPTLIKRFAARDPAIEILGEESCEGFQVTQVRVRKQRLYLLAHTTRCVVSQSKELLAAVLTKGPLPPELWPSGGQVYGSGMLRPEKGPAEMAALPFRLLRFRLRVEPAGVEVTGDVELKRPEVLEPFRAVAARSSALVHLVPAGGLAAVAVRVDFGRLYAALLELLPADRRAAIERKITGFEHLFLNGLKLKGILEGLGPEVVLVAADPPGGPVPVTPTLLCQVQTEAGRAGVKAIGRLLTGLSAMSGAETEQAAGDGGMIQRARFGGLELVMGVKDDRACVTTDAAVARHVLDAPEDGQSTGDLRDGIPPFHFFLGVDTGAVARWLVHRKTALLSEVARKDRYRRGTEIDAAIDLTRLFRYAACVVTATPSGLDVMVRLAFAGSEAHEG